MKHSESLDVDDLKKADRAAKGAKPNGNNKDGPQPLSSIDQELALE